MTQSDILAMGKEGSDWATAPSSLGRGSPERSCDLTSSCCTGKVDRKSSADTCAGAGSGRVCGRKRRRRRRKRADVRAALQIWSPASGKGPNPKRWSDKGWVKWDTVELSESLVHILGRSCRERKELGNCVACQSASCFVHIFQSSLLRGRTLAKLHYSSASFFRWWNLKKIYIFSPLHRQTCQFG